MNGQTLTCTVHILPLDNFTTKHSLCSNTIICVSVNTEVNTSKRKLNTAQKDWLLLDALKITNKKDKASVSSLLAHRLYPLS